MSKKQCCRSIDSIPLNCGTNPESLFDGMREIMSKNKDFNTRGGYLRDFLIRDNKTILLNFNRPANTPFVPPPGDFMNFDYNSTISTIETIVNRERQTNDRTKACLFPGSIDKITEEQLQGDGDKILTKTIKLFQKVIENTNLKILPVNIGINPPLDIRMTDDDIKRNNRADHDVEIVLDIIYTNTATHSFMEDLSGKAYNIGKSMAINPYNATSERNSQVLFINNLNNQFIYHELNPSLEDKDLYLFINIDPIYFYPNIPGTKEQFQAMINNRIQSAFLNFGLRNKFFYYLIRFEIIESFSPNTNVSYISRFTRYDSPTRNANLAEPTLCEIGIDPNQPPPLQRRNSFGIEPEHPLKFTNGVNVVSATFHTLFYTKMWLKQTNTRTIMHEFCHILGMVHEQERNVPGNPYLNHNYVWEPPERPPYFWNGTNLLGTPYYDKDSIMLYSFGSCKFGFFYQTCEFVNTRWNTKLSDGDKATLGRMYPKTIKTNGDMNVKHVENFLYKSKNNIFMYSICFIFIIVSFIIIIKCKCK